MVQEIPLRPELEKIAKEVEEAGCNKWQIMKILKELNQEEKLSMKELREKTINLLESINPQAAEVYSSFNKLLVYTSKEKIEAFDRGNIIRSLIRETDITRGIAEKIGSEVEDKIKDLKIPYLNTSLIREMVNVKLLEYGHESIQQQYTRLGLPVDEVKQRLEKNLIEDKEILREYNWLEVIPKKLRRMHFNSEIFIDAVEDFSSKPYAFALSPEIHETNNLTESLLEINSLLALLINSFSLPPSICSVNSLVSRYLKKNKKTLRETAKLIVKQFNSIYLNSANSMEKSPCLGLDLFFRDGLEEYSKFKSQSTELANQFLLELKGSQESTKFKTVVCVDSKYRLKLLDKELFEGKLTVINCSQKELLPLNNNLLAEKGNGVSYYAGLNLLKTALSAKGNESMFFNKLSEIISALNELTALKEKILEERKPFLAKEINLSRLRPGIGLAFLEESIRELLNEASQRETQKMGEKIVESIFSELEDKCIVNEFSLSEGLKKFAEENQGEKSNAGEKLLIKNYSNVVTASNRKELEDLIERKAYWIELLP